MALQTNRNTRRYSKKPHAYSAQRLATKSATPFERQAHNAQALASALKRYEAVTKQLLTGALREGGPSISHLYRHAFARSVIIAGSGRSDRPALPDGSQSFHFKLTAIRKIDPERATAPDSRAAKHQSYIEREQAVATTLPQDTHIDPMALIPLSFGNIGATPAERASFWKKVAETERSPGPARLRIHTDAQHAWWTDILNRPLVKVAPSLDRYDQAQFIETLNQHLGAANLIPELTDIARELIENANYHRKNELPPSVYYQLASGIPCVISDQATRETLVQWARELWLGRASAQLARTPSFILGAYARIRAGLLRPSRDGQTYDVPIPPHQAESIADWLLLEKAQDPPIQFVDNRAGVIQFRLVGELPHELSLEGKANIAKEISQFFAARNIPHWITIHQPDDHNDRRNWHAHLVYYDRPAKCLPDGRWDFEIVETKNNRHRHRPYMQKKDRDLNSHSWPRRFRTIYADIVNRELERERIAHKRYDPRSYADMGIMTNPTRHRGYNLSSPKAGSDQAGILQAAPDQPKGLGIAYRYHLGTNASARERKGLATPAGTNASMERSLAVLERADRAYQDAIDKAREKIAPWRRDVQARSVLAQYLAIRRRQAALTRQRTLFQEARRAALSRPTAAYHHFTRMLEKISANPSTPNREKRIQGIKSKIKQEADKIELLRQSLDPYWEGLERRTFLLRADLLKLSQIEASLKQAQSASATAGHRNSSTIEPAPLIP